MLNIEVRVILGGGQECFHRVGNMERKDRQWQFRWRISKYPKHFDLQLLDGLRRDEATSGRTQEGRGRRGSSAKVNPRRSIFVVQLLDGLRRDEANSWTDSGEAKPKVI